MLLSKTPLLFLLVPARLCIVHGSKNPLVDSVPRAYVGTALSHSLNPPPSLISRTHFPFPPPHTPARAADGGGDQPLLDVKFPDVSHHGQGLQLASCGVPTHATFDGRPPPPWYAGLTLWHAMPKEVKIAPPPTRNLSSSSYVQMYFLLRPRAENGGFAVTSAYREVLFRFGSWCYGGSVQLTPNITLADVPHVIPALRMQQSRLEFVYAADSVPATSPYAKPMSYMMKHLPLMEREISSAEDVLSKLVERLTAMGLGDSISAWLEGDASQSFFEFSVVASDAEAKCLEPVELIATKTYFASGILLIVIYFAGSFYCVVGDGGAEQPLLDSKFPDVSAKGRGYQVVDKLVEAGHDCSLMISSNSSAL